MNTIEMLQALRAMTVLGDIASGAVTVADLERLGVKDAGAWAKHAATYHGPTRQRAQQAAARAAGADLSPDALMVVEKHTCKLLAGAAVTEWELRFELCGLRGTVPEIDRLAADRVREYNRGVDDAAKKAYGRRGVTLLSWTPKLAGPPCPAEGCSHGTTTPIHRGVPPRRREPGPRYRTNDPGGRPAARPRRTTAR